MTVDTMRREVPVRDVRDGARIRFAVRGTKTTVAGTPLLTMEDGTSFALPGVLIVAVQNEPLPETADSVVRATVNDGPEETLVLAPNNAGNLRWRRVLAGSFASGADVIDNVRVLFQAPAAMQPPAPPATTTQGAKP